MRKNSFDDEVKNQDLVNFNLTKTTVLDRV